MEKNGSFGFSVLGCVSAKTKCAICAVGFLVCVVTVGSYPKGGTFTTELDLKN
jgi:hypothetical protein